MCARNEHTNETKRQHSAEEEEDDEKKCTKENILLTI